MQTHLPLNLVIMHEFKLMKLRKINSSSNPSLYSFRISKMHKWVFAKAKIGWCINCEFIFKKLCKCNISTKTFKAKVTLMKTEFVIGLFSFLAIWRSALFDWTDESSHAYTGGTLPKINLLKDILLLYFCWILGSTYIIQD